MSKIWDKVRSKRTGAKVMLIYGIISIALGVTGVMTTVGSILTSVSSLVASYIFYLESK